VLYAGIAESVASSALRQALNKQDDVLGPWVPGRDPLEDALAAYAGKPLTPLMLECDVHVSCIPGPKQFAIPRLPFKEVPLINSMGCYLSPEASHTLAMLSASNSLFV